MSLRAADLEVLFTVDTSQVEKAEKEVKQTGERIEKKPIKVEADASGALASMDRVEAEAKKLVSADTMLKLDAEVDKAQAQIDKTKQRLEELQVKSLAGLDVRAETGRAEAQLQKAQRSLDKLVAARDQIELDADASAALEAMAKVSAEGRRLVSQEVVTKVDTEISFAQKKVTRFEADLEVLRSKTPTVKVLADTAKAESALKEARGRLDDLNAARAVMVVDADVSPAEDALDGAAESADAAGAETGNAFGASTIAALASIPIAGAVVGIGAAAGKALVSEFQDALRVEVGYDRLQALTGISEVDALRLGRVAGEAYVRNFGESIEANMDTARLALQFKLIDDDASLRSSQRVIEGLSGIADVLGEDVRPVAAAVTTMLSSELAKSADEAFDILATGAREGVNRYEDLLDTLTEYPAVFSRLGISGQESLGLMNQSLKAGARNSDVAADALKEFQIRATDASEMSAAGFERLGLNAEEMTSKIARGGADAREGLALVLDKLRETEDPVVRNAAAVELFGTKAEDLGDALFAMDLTTAVAQLDGVTGSAQRMFDTLSSNEATQVEGMFRNIEVAADGVKGALAQAFGEPLGKFADWVSANRGPVLDFIFGLVNGAIDFGVAMLTSAADGGEALGEFVAGPVADIVEAMGTVQMITDPFSNWQSTYDLANSMRDFKDSTAETADVLRDKAIPALEDARERVNEYAGGAISIGYLNDASTKLAGSLMDLGTAADGSLLPLEGLDVANLSATESGSRLEGQLQRSVEALNAELGAAAAAGEGQTALSERYAAGTQAMADQLVAMGLTEEQAWNLINAYNAVPGEKTTVLSDNAVERRVEVDGLAMSILQLTDGSFTVHANTDDAYGRLTNLQAMLRTVTGDKSLHIATGAGGQGGLTFAQGGILEFMAQGGLTPMQPVAQMVPQNTWRVVGDRSDVPELYAPLDGSARSWGLLLEGFRRMPGTPPLMAEGGIVGSLSERVRQRDVAVYQDVKITMPRADPRPVVRELNRGVGEALGNV